jgi:3-hydroxybutyryl-CoA dehydratase
MPVELVVDPSTAPRRVPLGDVAVGDRCSERWSVDAAASEAFAACSNDTAPVHRDDAHARTLGYARRIVHGMQTSLRFSRLLGMFLPGSGAVIMNVSFDYLLPVYVGDALDYAVAVTHVSASGVVRLDCTVRRGTELCVKGRASCLLPAS